MFPSQLKSRLKIQFRQRRGFNLGYISSNNVNKKVNNEAKTTQNQKIQLWNMMITPLFHVQSSSGLKALRLRLRQFLQQSSQLSKPQRSFLTTGKFILRLAVSFPKCHPEYPSGPPLSLALQLCYAVEATAHKKAPL